MCFLLVLFLCLYLFFLSCSASTCCQCGCDIRQSLVRLRETSRYHYVALDIPCISIVTYVLNAPDTMGITHVITTFVFKSTRVFALWTTAHQADIAVSRGIGSFGTPMVHPASARTFSKTTRITSRHFPSTNFPALASQLVARSSTVDYPVSLSIVGGSLRRNSTAK